MIFKKISYTKKSLFFSLLMLMIWGLLGTGTTLAWFTDLTPVDQNTFYTGDLDLVVSYKDESGKYVEIDPTQSIFNDEALYEPGYVQVVYLKVENKGDIPFDFTTAVTVNDYTTAINKYGQTFNLIPYLKQGLIINEDENELNDLISTREKALTYAQNELNNYNSDIKTLEVNEDVYMALIVAMPTYVENDANHTGTAPIVKLGLNVKASQKGTLK